MALSHKKSKKSLRHRRVRAKIQGTFERPRLSVYRSNKHMVLQLIDDNARKTLVSVSTMISKENNTTKSERAFIAGELLAEKAKECHIIKIVFDRGGYQYHGRVQKVAEGARHGGLQF